MSAERFESKLNEWIIFIITALVIGLAIGLVNVALGNILREASYTANIEILAVGIVLIAVLTYLSFIFMIRPVRISSDVNCRLLYNVRRGDFLAASVYLAYYLAQEAVDCS